MYTGGIVKKTYTVPGIPSAPIVGDPRILRAFDYYCINKGNGLAHRLPYYSREEVTRYFAKSTLFLSWI
jgi:hypothetical protein